jgi:hypothetical protein
MAIVIYNDGDVSVGTIAERNALVKKFEGMLVNVADATADSNVGGGAATYRWDDSGSKWVTVWVENTPTLNFTTEKKLLSSGAVDADNIPADASVWSVRIIDSVTGRVLADARPTVAGTTISVGTSDYDGHYLEYTYAYGSIVAQIEAVIGEVYNKDEVDVEIATALTGVYTKAETDAKIVELAPAETITSITVVGNELRYVAEDGNTTAIDLSVYLDDTNLARLVSGSYDSGTNSLVFTRDDASTFSVDASAFFDDTNLVTSVSGKTGDVTLVKGDVGLGNVDNTADVDKPVSTATSTALATKVDKVTGKGLSTNDFTDLLKTKLDGIEEGATADQTKADIDALGVDAATVSGFTVGVNVPSGAVFTDTVYSKPASEPISYIDGLQTSLDGKVNSVDLGDYSSFTTAFDAASA